MSVYYNEWDGFCAQWLRNLMKAGLIPEGEVDERSITEVSPDDLAGFNQCHFFAGIGGWPYALKLAGWGDEPVWTGSCPCQPLSSAGQRKGHADERHLWPAFYRIIAERRPSIVFGEQVASKDGREWLAGIRIDLEDLGYACGAADLCAAGVGAPHIRQRLFWVADAKHPQSPRFRQYSGQTLPDEATELHREHSGWMGNPNGSRLQKRQHDGDEESRARLSSPWQEFERTNGRRVKPGVRLLAHGLSGRVGRLRGYGNAIVPQVAAAFIEAVMECTP